MDYKKTNYKDIFKENNLELIEKVANEIFSHNNTIIDFSAFDGLTIEEVYKIMGYSYDIPIIFVIYNSFESINSFNQKITYNGILYKLIIRGFKDKDNLIDEEVEETIIKNYQSFNKATKKHVNCFLQRYRYGTKEKTR